MDEDLTPTEPTLLDLVRELREAVGLFSGAMPITPQEAWREAVAHVRLLVQRPARGDAEAGETTFTERTMAMSKDAAWLAGELDARAAIRPPARGDAEAGERTLLPAEQDRVMAQAIRDALRERVARLESALEPLQSLTPTDMVPISGHHTSLANYARYWLVPLLSTKHPEGGAGCESSSSTLPSKPELPT